MRSSSWLAVAATSVTRLTATSPSRAARTAERRMAPPTQMGTRPLTGRTGSPPRSTPGQRRPPAGNLVEDHEIALAQNFVLGRARVVRVAPASRPRTVQHLGTSQVRLIKLVPTLVVGLPVGRVRRTSRRAV